MLRISSNTHQTPVGEESGASPDSRLHHLQIDICGYFHMVPVVVNRVDKLEEGNQVPGQDEGAGLVELNVGHGGGRNQLLCGDKYRLLEAQILFSSNATAVLLFRIS